MKRKPKSNELAGKTAVLPAPPQNEICSRFEAAVAKNLSPCLSGQNPVFLLALSGGADSTALAAVIAALRDKASADNRGLFSLYCLHVNHGLRSKEESKNDEKASAALCKKLDIPFFVTAIPPGAIQAYAKKHGTGIEGAARHFRHAALRKEARRLGVGAICIAHTASDRLETVLMAFLRGSGPAGLGAMARERHFTTSPPVIRPLITLTRSDVLAYLKERGLSYRTDKTNADERFFRNKVRLKLIPFLDEHFTGWRKPVERLGETQGLTAEFLRSEAERLLPWQKEKAFLPFPQNAALSADAERFFLLPLILREEALYNAIDRLVTVPAAEAGKKPRRDVLRSFIQGGQKTADLGFCRLEIKKDRVIARKTANIGDFSVLIKSQGVYKLKALTIKVSLTQDGLETGFFVFLPFVLRSGPGGTILAEDRQGRAAAINAQGQLDKRFPEQKPQTGDNQNIVYCTILLDGGWDAAGTE